MQVSDEERYHFDLTGFLILRGAIETDLVKALDDAVVANESIDHDESWLETTPEVTLQTLIRYYGENFQIKDRHAEYQTRLNGLQRLDPAFDSLVAHPRILPYLQTFMKDPQFVNGWSISKYEGRAATGWHAGLKVEEYRVDGGIIHSPMVNVVTMLTPNHPGDGCFGVMPGSHKRNFTLDGERWGQAGLEAPGAVEITGDPGDVMIFSEALLHAGMNKTTKRRRTTLQYNHVDRARISLMADLQNVRHFWMPPAVRERFSPAQKKLTDWMEIMPEPRSLA
jgi:ectoine hydroxylase-related dioxygenase (phytanoyl-CoA dioxygenase family)